MKSLLHATLLLTFLVAAAWLLALFSGTPMPVNVTVGTTNLQTSLPVAVALLLAVLVIVFYLGRLTGWFLRLPGTLLHIRNRKAGQQLAEAYAAYFMSDDPTAEKRLEAFKPDSESHATLADILKLHYTLAAQALPTSLEKKLANPNTAALAAWAAARHYATQFQWDDVARITAKGRTLAPTHLPLLTLQFKALVNLNDPQAASLLPPLKPHLGTAKTKLLSDVLQGVDALSARPVLDNAWIKSFQKWLPTASEVFPNESKE